MKKKPTVSVKEAHRNYMLAIR